MPEDFVPARVLVGEKACNQPTVTLVMPPFGDLSLPVGESFAQVREQLQELLGVDSSYFAGIRCQGQLLTDGSIVGTAPLTHGAVLAASAAGMCAAGMSTASASATGTGATGAGTRPRRTGLVHDRTGPRNSSAGGLHQDLLSQQEPEPSPLDLTILEQAHLCLLHNNAGTRRLVSLDRATTTNPSTSAPHKQFFKRATSLGEVVTVDDKIRVCGDRVSLHREMKLWPRSPESSWSNLGALLKTTRAHWAWQCAQILGYGPLAHALAVRWRDTDVAYAPASHTPRRASPVRSRTSLRSQPRISVGTDTAGQPFTGLGYSVFGSTAMADTNHHWYELRSGIALGELTRILRAPAKEFSSTASERRSLASVLATILIPLSMSAVIALVMQQHAFLLFALAGPLMALVQFMTNKSHTTTQTSTPTRRSRNGTYSQRPHWVTEAKQIVEDLRTPDRHDVISTTVHALWQVPMAAAEQLALNRLATHHVLLLELLSQNYLRLPTPPQHSSVQPKGSPSNPRFVHELRGPYTSSHPRETTGGRTTAIHHASSVECTYTHGRMSRAHEPGRRVSRAQSHELVTRWAVYHTLLRQLTLASGCSHELPIAQVQVNSASRHYWHWSRWIDPSLLTLSERWVPGTSPSAVSHEHQKRVVSIRHEVPAFLAAGLSAVDLPVEGLLSVGIPTAGLHADGWRAEGLRADGLRADGLRAEASMTHGSSSLGVQSSVLVSVSHQEGLLVLDLPQVHAATTHNTKKGVQTLPRARPYVPRTPLFRRGGWGLTQFSQSTVSAATSQDLERFAKSLLMGNNSAPRDGLPDLAQFSALAAFQDFPDAWSVTSTNDLVFPIGINDRQETIMLDLVADGPHMLVAGTTGSGKSEFLQTLITALAMKYPPSHVQFILMDYKGGAGLGTCARLPHSIGMVTDLDPTETMRALDSIQQELHARESKFAQSEVTSIDQYNRTSTAPLPRLVIVLDEFRVLGDQHPQALDQLIRLAAQGRSLGIHLVLATQRPSGAISADIKANVTIRIALRVSDAQDSNDVIGTPAAAQISARNPGRLCFARGTDLVQTVQSYYISAHGHQRTLASFSGDWHQLSSPQSPQFTQTPLDKILETQTLSVKRMWAQPLPKKISARTTHQQPQHEPNSWACAALQSKAELTWLEPEHCQGNLFISGAPRRGKSTTAHAIARAWRASGADVHWIGPEPESTSTSALCSRIDSQNAHAIYSLLRQLTRPATSSRSCSCESETQDQSSLGIGTKEPETAEPGPLEHGSSKPSSPKPSSPKPSSSVLSTLEPGHPEQASPIVGKGCSRMHHHSTDQQILIVDSYEAFQESIESFARGEAIALFQVLVRDAARLNISVIVTSHKALPHSLLSLFPSRLYLGSGSSESDQELGMFRKIPALGPEIGRGYLTGPSLEGPVQVVNAVGAPPVSGDHFCSVRYEPLRTAQPLKPTEITYGATQQRLNLADLRHVVVTGPRGSGANILLDELAHATGPSVILNGKEVTDRALLAQAREEIGKNAHPLVVHDLDALERAFPIEAGTLIETALSSGAAIFASASMQSLMQAFRGPLSTLAEECVGVILRGIEPVPRELFGTALHTAADEEPYSGRAIVTWGGQAQAARVWIKAK